jgi:tyrosine-protein kinase Etk/Wzc
VRRHPVLFAGVPLALLALTLLFVLLVPPVYEASSSIRVDEERSSVAVLDVLQSLSSGSEVYTEMAVLESRSLAEAVVQALDLQVALASPGRTLRSEILGEVRADTAAPEATYRFARVGEDRWAVTGTLVQAPDLFRPLSRARAEERTFGEVGLGQPVDLAGVRVSLGPGAADADEIEVGVVRFQDAVRELQGRTEVRRPDREADVVEIRYRGGDPELVREVADTMAALFIRRRQSDQSAEARNTVTFLREQIDTLERQLGQAEETLRDFREREGVVALEAEADAQIERLATMRAERDLMDAERSALGDLLEEIQREAGGAPSPGEESPYRRLLAFPSLLRNPATAELLGQLAELENNLSQLLIGRTPQDRDVRMSMERIRTLESQLQAIAETYLESLTRQVASYDRQLAASADELAEIPETEMTFIRLRRESEVLSDLYTLLQTRQKEAQIAAAVEDESVRVVDPAIFPSEPVRPRPWLSLGLALVLGVAGGLASVVAAEHMDRAVHDRHQLQAITDASVLGLIPTIEVAPVARGGRWRRRAPTGRPRLIETATSGHPAAEAYRSLRTNIRFARTERPPRSLVFTSPMPGDGKSTTAGNLALVLAHQGHPVLLVDADMRRGVLNEVFDLPHEPGLSDILAGQTPFDQAVRTVDLDGHGELDFLAGGTRPPNPSELLASRAMADLLSALRDRYELVVFDAPPLNLVTDAALLGTRADGVILVARAGVTEEGSLAFSVDQLERVRAPLLGTVLNGLDERRQEYYGGRGSEAYSYFQANGR